MTKIASCRYKIGDRVTWEGQIGPIVATVMKITRSETGGYVLWTALNPKDKDRDESWWFPIGENSVSRYRSLVMAPSGPSQNPQVQARE